MSVLCWILFVVAVVVIANIAFVFTGAGAMGMLEMGCSLYEDRDTRWRSYPAMIIFALVYFPILYGVCGFVVWWLWRVLH